MNEGMPEGFPFFSEGTMAGMTWKTLFDGLVEGGFTEDQALTLIAKVLAESAKGM